MIIEKVQRNILADKPRITRFDIDWGSDSGKSLSDQTEKFFNDKTNIADMKNELFCDMDKKTLESQLQIGKDVAIVSGGALLKDKNPFLEG